MPDYVLHITSEWKVLGCTNRNSVMVNGSIPGPTIEMYEGQTIVVRVINHLEASPEIQHLDMMVHWHGVRVHPMMDGTPVSQYPIKPEKCFDYVLSALPGSAGTYMYVLSRASLFFVLLVYPDEIYITNTDLEGQD